MKPRFPLAFAIALLALVAGGGAAYALQREKTMHLRAELGQARANAAEWSRLQAENQRLRQKQVAPSELSRLREDRGLRKTSRGCERRHVLTLGAAKDVTS